MLTAIAPGLVPEHRRCMTTSPVPIAAPPPPPPPPPPTSSTPLPRALRASAGVAQGVLALFALVAPVAIGVNLAQRDLLTRIQDAPGSVRLSDLQLSDDRVSALNVVWWVFIGLSVVTWMVWWVSAYRAAADRRALRYGKGWAFGGWFVPFANLVVPKRVADDLWTASREPDWPRDAEARSSWDILAWWGAWLLCGVLGFLAVRSDHSTTGRLLTMNAIYLVRAVVVLVAAVLAIRFIGLVTAGFAAQVGIEGRDRAASRRLVVAAGIVGLVVVVAGTVVSRGAFDVPSHATDGTADRRYTPAAQHFSITVPRDWVLVDDDDLPAGVTFAAAQLSGDSGVTVVEGPAGAAMAADEVRSGLPTQFDVIGDVEQTTVALPAGDADCFTFTALIEDTPMDGRVYVFRGTEHDHVLVLLAAQELSADGSRTLDRIARSFQLEDGQGA